MIALLTGTVAHKSPEYIVLDVQGVGYRVQIPFSTYYDLPPVGGHLSLTIYTHVKEDAINLYGFRTTTEKQFFQLLISVSGIGPKLAKDILSNIQVDELGDALLRGDLARLCAIPGIGRKTAERVVLELREKVRKLDLLPPAQSTERPTAAVDIMEDVTSALINLGYKEAVVKKVLAELSITPDTGMETILKQALKQLMR
ncbi:MAG: Holliday junction branch migration protein RuvA [Geobacter sp.]|nr:MAG: Holliday junction branch migration protein RuvA [Geobacter sp.]